MNFREVFRSGSQAGKLRLLLCLLAAMQVAAAADFTVTAPGFFYSINGQQPNPTLTLVRGEVYTFAVSSGSFHPFRINSPAGSTSNNPTGSGTITFRVPMIDSNYTYVCTIHNFGGRILTIPPPVVRIVGMELGTNVVLRSTGTNNWRLTPQFSTNLGTTNWFALTVQTNRFANGTNETICGRPVGSNVFIRMRAQRN